MTNPAIHPQPNGDVDITVPDDQVQSLLAGETETAPEPTVDPDNLEHPEELMGE
jgi:hypothetical protein